MSRAAAHRGGSEMTRKETRRLKQSRANPKLT
jgi:hypothetical protein